MKKIIKSNSAFVVASSFPAWKTGQERGYLFPLVQGSEISIDAQRQSSKQIGKQTYAIDDVLRNPEVNFQVGYISSPYWVNEYLIGMNISSGDYAPVFSGLSEKNQNYYLIVDEKKDNDGMQEFKKPSSRNLSGVTVASIGNCFLNKYSASYSVGNLPIVSASFAGSNVQFEILTGASIKMPAVNFQSGNSSGVGSLNLNNLDITVTGIPNINYPYGNYSVPVASPNVTQVYLNDLQVGGISLSATNALVESFNLDVNLDRQDLYGLGSNHVYGRKLLFPINATIDISALITGLKSGDLSGMFTSESGYNMTLEINDTKNSAKTELKIQNAKLNTYSFDMAINDRMNFSANYSFSITETGGLLAKFTQ